MLYQTQEVSFKQEKKELGTKYNGQTVYKNVCYIA